MVRTPSAGLNDALANSNFTHLLPCNNSLDTNIRDSWIIYDIPYLRPTTISILVGTCIDI